MKPIRTIFKSILSTILFAFSFSTFASDLPDPEVLAKQYLKDLCTLNEQDFTRKYMLTQADAETFINEMTKSYLESNNKPSEKFSDSLKIRSEVHSLVVKSYRQFKEWQHENKIDSSKIKYHSCEFELEKKRKVPYYGIDGMSIYFSYDTLKYAMGCDDFLFLKTKWVGGDFDGIDAVDKYLNKIYDDYATDTVAVAYDYVETDYAVDTVAAVDYDYETVGEKNEYTGETPPTKKQLKIQKKIEGYNRKIEVLIEEYDKSEY
ncbi:hypothetical protein [Cytophaga aurantiaca]|uniref:hypothetical protein n=1 Tax=Cytophaga aurantiaca TaxID=29530 RepID=UPI0003745F88|nr:hypothetical protein [Cytophaga aurantiaca]